MNPNVLGLGLNLVSATCSLCEQEQATRLLLAEHCLGLFRLTSGQAAITIPCPVADGQTESRGILHLRGLWVIELGFKESCVSRCFFKVKGSTGGVGWRLKAAQLGWLCAPKSLFWKEFTVICLIITHSLEKGLTLKRHWKIITFLLPYALLTYLSSWLFTVC